MRALVQIDLDAIAHNIAEVRKRTIAPILAVVKADAYGHGLVPVATTAIDSGATWLGVALLEEAISLREAGIEVPIIAWLTPPHDDFEAALKNNIDLSVSSVQLFEEMGDGLVVLSWDDDVLQQFGVAAGDLTQHLAQGIRGG